MKQNKKQDNVKTFPRTAGYESLAAEPLIEGVRLPGTNGGYKLHLPGALSNGIHTGINTDPLGSWTGVPTDDPMEKPVQDADDL